MVKQYALSALQKAINYALSLDDSMPLKLKALDGRVLHLIISPLQRGFFIQFHEDHLILLDTFHGVVDTTIQSSPLGFIRLSLLPASKVRSLFNDRITITGDVELGQQVKRIFDEMDIDWEAHLAQFTGDAVAFQLGSMVRKGLAFTQRVHTSMQQNLTEYVQEEVRLFPPREEVSDFFNDVDTLSLDVERLEAHVNQLLLNHETD